MSTLAKIFVVINFALAVAFLVFSVTLYSKRVKYNQMYSAGEVERKDTDKAFRQMYQSFMGTPFADNQKINLDTAMTDQQGSTLRKLIEDKVAAIKKGEDDKKAALDEAGVMKASAESLKMKLEEAGKKEADARNTANAVSSQNTVLLEQVQKMRAELEDTRKTVMALKENNVRLQMDASEYSKQLVDAQNANTTLKQNIEDLHKDRTRLAEDLANAEYMLKQAVKDGWKPQVAVKVPDVRTKVVDVRNTGNVALGAGSDSGIKEGAIFLIYRGKDAELIGKIRVTTVWNDFAGGQVIEARKPIQAGDDAMSSAGI